MALFYRGHVRSCNALYHDRGLTGQRLQLWQFVLYTSHAYSTYAIDINLVDKTIRIVVVAIVSHSLQQCDQLTVSLLCMCVGSRPAYLHITHAYPR